MSSPTHTLDKLVEEIKSLKGKIKRLEAQSRGGIVVEKKLIEARERAVKAGHGKKGRK